MKTNLEMNNSVLSQNSVLSNLSQERKLRSDSKKAKIQKTPKTGAQVTDSVKERDCD